MEPSEHLNRAMRDYPQTGRMIEDFRAKRGTELPDWSRWCFLPIAGFYAIVSYHLGVERIPPTHTSEIARLAALGTWRYTQGIYRVDPDLCAALFDSPLSGAIPCETLHRLPEWCVYVELPTISDGHALLEGIQGYWAHLEHDANDGRTELRLLLNGGDQLIALPLHLGPWPLSEAIERHLQEAKRQSIRLGNSANQDQLNPLGDYTDHVVRQVGPLVSLLLYLCTAEPEIVDREEPERRPRNPEPRKTKKGLRLFPANRVTIWDVGREQGEQLRRSGVTETDEGQPTGRRVRAHVRRGHWHGYWVGPRDSDQRRFEFRWLPPLVVGGAAPEKDRS